MHPILFQYGPLEIRFYGLMYVVAIVVGSYLIKAEVKRRSIHLNEDDVMNFIVWTVIGGIIGARIYYVAFNWPYYWANPAEMPAVWHGGLAIHGGMIGGITSAWVFLKKHKAPFWRMADAIAPALILGQAFGRLGNFMNGDAHGRPTEMPWGIIFPPESIAGTEFPGLALHPTMLYELAINLSIFIFLWFVLRRKEAKDGFIFAVYFGLYSTGRLIVEQFRADSLMIGPLKAAQMVSILLIISVAMLIWKKRLWEPATATKGKKL